MDDLLRAKEKHMGHWHRLMRRMPFKDRRNNIILLLGGLWLLLLIAAGITYWCIYSEGDTAAQSAKSLLGAYEQKAAQASPPASPAATEEGYVQPDKPEVEPQQAAISLPGYDVIGKLIIGKIGVELPVISKTTDKALKVSICFFGGVLPGEKGNTIITGHNYANGAHFGKLDQLKAGDAVEFDAPGGKAYHYSVYETQVIKPDEPEALDRYTGDTVLTLVTCTSQGNRRLLVRCIFSQP